MPKKGIFKSVEQYQAEATKNKNGCLILRQTSRKGRMNRSEEFKLHVGESKKGNTYGKANKGKRSNKGTPKSKEHKRALSKAHIIRSEFFRLMLQNNH